MKKLTLFIALFLLLVGCIAFCNASNKQYLRIHIRANSNGSADQQVKYLVKDAVTDFLAPLLANKTTKRQAQAVISANLDAISRVATEVLNANGFFYRATAKLKTEHFPTRNYADLCLGEGIYDALIISLGSGAGDNWWCVIYPPLCFMPVSINGGEEIVYKSKIVEIFNSLFGE